MLQTLIHLLHFIVTVTTPTQSSVGLVSLTRDLTTSLFEISQLPLCDIILPHPSVINSLIESLTYIDFFFSGLLSLLATVYTLLYTIVTTLLSIAENLWDLFFKLSMYIEPSLSFLKDTFYSWYVANESAPIVVKLSVALAFLAAVKGGTPRYRYDFLTKMGWVKFLGYLLCVFLATLLIFSLYL